MDLREIYDFAQVESDTGGYLVISQTDWARLFGTTRPQITQALRRLEASGAITQVNADYWRVERWPGSPAALPSSLH